LKEVAWLIKLVRRFSNPLVCGLAVNVVHSHVRLNSRWTQARRPARWCYRPGRGRRARTLADRRARESGPAKCPRKGQALGAPANDSGHEEDCYASSARSRVQADRRWTGCWSGNYLSRRPGGFQNSGKGFLNPSYAWIRPHRDSPARQLADITSINVVFRSLATVIHFFSTDLNHFLRLRKAGLLRPDSPAINVRWACK